MNSLAPLPPRPNNEAARLRALRRYGVLDTPADASFDALTALASQLFNVPTALVSLVDENRQWFKARVGMEVCQTGRNEAFCAWALLEDDILEVTDPANDPRFAHNPLVLGPPYISFYAGAQLRTKDGLVLGTFCLIDSRPRSPLTPSERDTLRTLAAAAMGELDHHAAQVHAELALIAANELELLTQERLGVLAERIKTPLTSVLGYSQLVQKVGAKTSEQGLNPQQAEKLVRYAESIQQAGQSLLELVNVSLEPMRLPPSHADDAECDLHALLDEVCTLATPLAESRSMAVRLHLTTSQQVHVEAVRLKRVVLALVSNALRHAQRGTIDLLVTPSPNAIRLSIRDQGPGLPTSAQHLLTDPSPHLPKSRGGLALVRTLCHMMGLDISVDSSPQSGCTIHLDLPLSA
jgi:signal transduction histidine kinase